MSKPSRHTLFALRVSELWDEPLSKVIAAFVAGALIMLASYALGYVPDPMLSHGRGPGWECDATRPAAVTCARDVRLPPPKRTSN